MFKTSVKYKYKRCWKHSSLSETLAPYFSGRGYIWICYAWKAGHLRRPQEVDAWRSFIRLESQGKWFFETRLGLYPRVWLPRSGGQHKWQRCWKQRFHGSSEANSAQLEMSLPHSNFRIEQTRWTNRNQSPRSNKINPGWDAMADVAENWEHEKLDVYTKSIRYVRSHEIIKKKLSSSNNPNWGCIKSNSGSMKFIYLVMAQNCGIMFSNIPSIVWCL